MRTGGVPAAGAAKAGTMASRNGRATAVEMPAPTPRRKARRGSDLRVIMAVVIMVVVPLFAIETADCAQSGRSTTGTRELGWAEGIGMNTMRVFLHNLAWEQDPKGFEHRVDTFLTIAARHHIRPVFVLFASR